MRNLKIAICDDEKIIREQVRELLKRERPDICPELYESGAELLAAGTRFDIVFLDIRMEGSNGIETAAMLRERDEGTLVIFITGLKEYVFEAFDVSAFHYLLKPVEEEKFREVLRRAEEEIQKRQKWQNRTLFIKTRRQNITLEQDSILYIESRAKKVEIHTREDVIGMYASMNALEEKLDGCFYRCHRGYLVNMAHIAEYNSHSITLNNGECICLSGEKYGEFVKRYMWYLRNGGTVGV